MLNGLDLDLQQEYDNRMNLLRVTSKLSKAESAKFWKRKLYVITSTILKISHLKYLTHLLWNEHTDFQQFAQEDAAVKSNLKFIRMHHIRYRLLLILTDRST